MKIRIGIDIGSDGAWAMFVDGRLFYGKIPDKDGELNMKQLLGAIYSKLPYSTLDDDVHIVIEDLHSVHGSSAKSNFSFGINNGLVIGMIQIIGDPYTKVSPKKWQKEMWEGVRPVMKVDGKKKNKDGTQKYKIDTKATSLIAAKRLFPNETFLATERSKVPHNGIIDSVLMAEYCRRNF